MKPTPLSPVDVRFWAKVAPAEVDACWHWLGSLNHKGYGSCWTGTGTMLAHRYAYELLIGPVPEGLQLDHLCRVRQCINPWHMDPVTPKINTERGKSNLARMTATHCGRGHRYTTKNTRIIPGTRERVCRTCAREDTRAYRARLAEKRSA